MRKLSRSKSEIEQTCVVIIESVEIESSGEIMEVFEPRLVYLDCFKEYGSSKKNEKMRVG